MPKNIVQDVIPPKRSIRNVELSSRARDTKGSKVKISKKSEPAPPVMEQTAQDFTNRVAVKKTASAPEPPEIIDVVHKTPPPVTPPPPPPPKSPISTPSYTYEYDDNKKSSKKWLYMAFVLLILAAAFGISALFKSAEISITPKQQNLAVNISLVAKKDATGSDLGFQVVTVTKDIQKTVDATGSAQVNTKATGTIIVYNNYSAAPQDLVANTRFQTSDGLVYRLTKSINIPGRTTSGGKTLAGSIEATVVADQVGSQYNIGLTDFTVPGLQGGPKYTGIYGRSKTEMSGGFSGIQKTVSKDIQAAADIQMQTSLQTLLSQNIAMQIPANFVFFPASISYTFSPIMQASSTDSTAVLDKKGTVSGVIFDKSALTKSIFTKTNSTLTADMAKIINLDTLNFSYATGTLPSSVNSNTSSITFTLSGNANAVWIFDQNKLQSDLLGLSKQSAEAVIASYPGVQEAWIVTQPFWNQNIPTDAKKVTILNTLDSPIAK